MQVEDPSVIAALSDAVKRHPSLIAVTVGEGCSGSLSRGVVQGVLQKADVQMVDVMESWNTILNPHSKLAHTMSPECEYSLMHACAHTVMHGFSFQLAACVYCIIYVIYKCMRLGTVNDTVQDYLIPAMKRGSLKTLAVRLTNSSSVDSILRELPNTKMEELAIAMEHHSYSEEVRIL